MCGTTSAKAAASVAWPDVCRNGERGRLSWSRAGLPDVALDLLTITPGDSRLLAAGDKIYVRSGAGWQPVEFNGDANGFIASAHGHAPGRGRVILSLAADDRAVYVGTAQGL